MKKILFPTDFSATSMNSGDYAVEIAKKTSAEMYILNVYSVTIYDPNMPAELLMSATEQAEKTSKEALDKVCADYKAKGCENVTCISRQGLVVDEIINFVEENSIDMVVMGTTGEGGILEKIFGSNTSSVIAKTPKPVLAVPDEAKFSDIKTIVYATDLQEAETDEIIEVTQVAEIFGAEVILLHICDKSEEAMMEEKNVLYEELKKNVNYPKIGFELVYNEDVIDGITDYLKNNPADIVAMATHQRSLLGRIFTRSLTKSMVYHTHTPLLAIDRND
jgi:nucleotide-binding universal stress UspA family protein